MIFRGFAPRLRPLGLAAPAILIIFRILQGLAAGGEYGGALVYVAEHSSATQRAQNTSWINAMGAIGIILALLVTLAVRYTIGEIAFMDWGWRLPFLLSIVLFGISMWIRLTLKESPVFTEMKAKGKLSKSPVRETFGSPRHAKVAICLALGGTAALGVMAYTSQFYTQFFLARTLKLDAVTINLIMIAALLLASPFYLFFGWLSDRVGRKPVILGGALVAALVIQPAFHALTHYGNPKLENALHANPVKIVVPEDQCSIQFNLLSSGDFRTSCDIAQTLLAGQMISYEKVEKAEQAITQVMIGSDVVDSFNGHALDDDAFKVQQAAFAATVRSTLDKNGYPTSATENKVNRPMLMLIVLGLLVLYAAVYAPISHRLT